MTKRLCTSEHKRKRKNELLQKLRKQKELPNIKVYITDYCANDSDDGFVEGDPMMIKTKRMVEKYTSNSSFLNKGDCNEDGEKEEQSKKISIETQHTIFSLLRQSSFKQSSFRKKYNSRMMTRGGSIKSETNV